MYKFSKWAHTHPAKILNLYTGCKGFNRHQRVVFITVLLVHNFVKLEVYKLLKPSNLYKITQKQTIINELKRL